MTQVLLLTILLIRIVTQNARQLWNYDMRRRQIGEIRYRLAKPGKDVDRVLALGTLHSTSSLPFRPPIDPILSPLPSLLLVAPLTQSLFPSLHLCLAPNTRSPSRLCLVVWLLCRVVVAGLVLIRRRTGLLVGVLRVRTHLGVWCSR